MTMIYNDYCFQIVFCFLNISILIFHRPKRFYIQSFITCIYFTKYYLHKYTQRDIVGLLSVVSTIRGAALGK
jgi:hypothetical protein